MPAGAVCVAQAADSLTLAAAEAAALAGTTSSSVCSSVWSSRQCVCVEHAPTMSIHSSWAPAFRPEPARNQQAATIMVICREGQRQQRCSRGGGVRGKGGRKQRQRPAALQHGWAGAAVGWHAQAAAALKQREQNGSL